MNENVNYTRPDPLCSTTMGREPTKKDDAMHITVHREHGKYVAHEDTFRLFVSGKTLKEVFDGIIEEIEMLWDGYVECDEAELSGDVLWLRAQLVAAFGGEMAARQEAQEKERLRAIEGLEAILNEPAPKATSLLEKLKARMGL